MHALVAALALACACSPALAAEAGDAGNTAAVIVPYGAWIVVLAEMARDILVPLLTAFILGVLARLYPLARMMLSEELVERTLRKWFEFGVNATRDAAKDKVVRVEVGSEIIANALRRATDRADAGSISRWVMAQAGGPEEIARKLFRLLRLEEGATASQVIEPALRKAALPLPIADR